MSDPSLPCLSELGAQRQGRLHDTRLVLVTDGRTATDDLAGFLDAVLAASVDAVRLHDTALDDERLAAAAQIARAACDRYGALLLVDDRADVALATGADGVHVGQGGAAVVEVRAWAGPDLLLGRSTQDARDLAASAEEDVDYVTVPAAPASGQPPPSPGPPADFDLVGHAGTASPHAWFAIGGITPASIDAVLAAGARRVMVGTALTGASDPTEEAWTLRRALARYPMP